MLSLWILGAFFPTPLLLIMFPAFTSLFPSSLLPNCPIVADTLVCPLNTIPLNFLATRIPVFFRNQMGIWFWKSWSLLQSQNMKPDLFSKYDPLTCRYLWELFRGSLGQNYFHNDSKRHYLPFSLCWQTLTCTANCKSSGG